MNFYDTNILLSNLEYVKQNGKFRIAPTTISELENIKTSANKDDEVKFQARRAVRYLMENRDVWETSILRENEIDMWRNRYGLPYNNDSEIICHFKNDESQFAEKGIPFYFVTNDLLCGLFAQETSENVVILNDIVEEKIYSGFQEIELTNEQFILIYNEYECGNNPYELIENEYLIVHCEGKTTEYAYRNNSLVPLKLPKGIKALNEKQRCVLDLLENEDIPIKIICGVYGTGKTYLSVNVAVNKITKNYKSDFSKIFFVRQPYGEGDEIGFLKGTKEDKIKDFFNPIVDNLEDGIFTLEDMINRGQIECDIPFYMKGRSLSSTIMLVDEAEDLTLKQIKLLGSRIADKSNIVFMGDWKQATGKYEYNCGLVQLIKHVKNNPSPLIGVMVMDEDVRSNASKYFADIV